MPKTWPLCTSAKLNLGDEFWVKQKRISLLLCQVKGDIVGLCPQKLCVPTQGFGEEFYSNGSRVGLLIIIRVCAGPALLQSGLRQSPDELLWFLRLSDCDLLWNEERFIKYLTSSICWGFQFCRRAQRYCHVYPLRRNQDPAPRLHYCFLTASPLSLYHLLSLVNSCLNLPFGTQGRSWRLKPISYKQETGDTNRLLWLGAPQGPAWFQEETRKKATLLLTKS